jgi:acyl-coenzyme A thioesterase PaaI-like protein
MRIAPHHNGPPGTANGGVVAGRLAAYVGAPVCEVTLRRPPPLGRDLRVEAAGGQARLWEGDRLVAEAVPSTVDLEAPAPVPAAVAAAAHDPGAAPMFASCFVCGVDREPPDGLGVRLGVVREGVSAGVWTPADADPVMVWAALDCPGGWAEQTPERPLLTGRMAVDVRGSLRVGEPHVVTGWTVAREGRKVLTGSALHDPDGALVALGRATWLVLEAGATG